MNKQLNTKGLGLVGILVVVAVVALVGFSGWLVWHKNHETKKTSSTSNSKSTENKNSTSTSNSSAATSDPYEGWKTYTDAQCGYSFRYPANWNMEVTSTGVDLENPTQTLQASYTANDSHDQGPTDFTVTEIAAIDATGLSAVGGYQPTSGVVGNYWPKYEIAETASVSSYGLQVGKKSQFVNNPMFKHQSSSSSCTSSFRAIPAVTINTVSDALDWLNSSDAKTSLLILKSLSYKNE